MNTTQHRETVRIPVDELMTYAAGDFGGRPMSEALEGMHARWGDDGLYAHSAEISAGGVEEYIADLADSMAKGGYNPAYPIDITELADGTRLVNNGHHRSLAAKRAGLREVYATVYRRGVPRPPSPASPPEATPAPTLYDIAREARHSRREARVREADRRAAQIRAYADITAGFFGNYVDSDPVFSDSL